MGALILGAACILCAAQPAQPFSVAHWQPIITEASETFHVPASWIARVMQVESGGRATLDGRPVTSAAGAMGLMQIMPGTYAALRRRYGLGTDPYDPHDNIFAGAACLHALYRSYGYPLLFAAYEAGPARVDAWLFDGRPLPKVTLAYVRSIVSGTILSSPQAVSYAVSGREIAKSRTRKRVIASDEMAPETRKSDAVAASQRASSRTNSVFATNAGGRQLFVPLSLQNR